jgi:hypothetical protein
MAGDSILNQSDRFRVLIILTPRLIKYTVPTQLQVDLCGNEDKSTAIGSRKPVNSYPVEQPVQRALRQDAFQERK